MINTGWKNGVRNLELKLGRPLQWFICLLHFNELTFRHFLESVDSDTTEPTSFSGQISKNLTDYETLPVANFETIYNEKIDVTKTDLKRAISIYLIFIIQSRQKSVHQISL